MEAIYNIQDLPKLETKADPLEYRKFYDQTSGFSAASASGVKSHFSFRISDINSFWVLSRGYLLFEFDVTNTSGNERQTVEYLGKHIDRCLLRLGDTLIEDKTKHVYRDSEVDCLQWSRQYADTVGSMMLYKPESIDKSDSRVTNLSKALYYKDSAIASSADLTTLLARLEATPDPFDVPGTLENYNATATRESRTYAMLPLIHLFNFLKVYDKVMRGLDIEIELYMAPDSVRIIRSGKLSTGANSVANDNATFVWSGPGITLMVPRVVPTPRIQAMLNMQLAKGLTSRVEFEKSHVYRMTIPDGTSQGEWSITTATSTPTRIYLFVRSVASETNQRERLQDYDQLLTRADIFVNGEKIPNESLQAEGATGTGYLGRNFMTYLRQWHDMQGNIGNPYHGETGHSNIDFLGFAEYGIVAIDLKQKISDFPDRSSDINLAYQLDTATQAGTPQYLYAVVFSKAVADLELSESRSVALIR